MLRAEATNRLDSCLNQVAGAVEIKMPDRKRRKLTKSHFSSFLSDREFLNVFLCGFNSMIGSMPPRLLKDSAAAAS